MTENILISDAQVVSFFCWTSKFKYLKNFKYIHYGDSR